MLTRRVLVNGEEIEVTDGTTAADLKRHAGIPPERSLAALGPEPGQARIVGRDEVLDDDFAFADVPVFRYG